MVRVAQPASLWIHVLFCFWYCFVLGSCFCTCCLFCFGSPYSSHVSLPLYSLLYRLHTARKYHRVQAAARRHKQKYDPQRCLAQCLHGCTVGTVLPLFSQRYSNNRSFASVKGVRCNTEGFFTPRLTTLVGSSYVVCLACQYLLYSGFRITPSPDTVYYVCVYVLCVWARGSACRFIRWSFGSLIETPTYSDNAGSQQQGKETG